MGTNYYAQTPALPIPEDNGDDRGLHVGKSSAGWRFLLRAHREVEPSLVSWQAWRRFLQLPGVVLIDEYGHTDYTVAQLLKRLDGEAGHPEGKRCDPCEEDCSRSFHDAEGYPLHDGEFC